MSSHTVSLLPGLDAEITQAQRDTIWSAPGHSRLGGVGLKLPYLFISSFADNKKHSIPRQPQPRPPRTQSTPATVNRPPRQTRSSTLSNSSNPEPQFLVQLPPVVVIQEEGIDPWNLHCVCEERSGIGLLVGCEKCGSWQHAICVGLNMHTIPDNYICEICGKRPIRCKCGNNLNYRFSIIKCSQCGYYVHRRCVGLHYGPLPRGDFICNNCGKSKFSYAKIRLPHSVKLDEDTTFTFTQEKVETIPPHFLTGPFNDFLTIDVAEATLNARDFCESLYDRFRSFFFICHPLNPNVISRKKRNGLFTSFINGTEQLCRIFYHLDHAQFLSVFDNLICTDLYAPFSEALTPYDNGCEITENTRFELARIANTVRLSSIPQQVPFDITEDGIVSRSELYQDQFIMLADGLIGDLEEFNYDNGVSSAFFQIADTRLVLDTTHVKSSPLHSIHRSMDSNCLLKIVLVGDSVHCGLFVGKSSLSTIRNEDIVISPGEQILFGIDFMPAVLEDVSKWIGWHCPDLEEHNTNRPSRDERDLHAAIRQFEGRRTKPVKNKKKADQLKKSARTAKPKKKGSISFSTDLSLFDLFESDGPQNYLFTVTDDIEEYQRRIAEAAAPKPTAPKPIAPKPIAPKSIAPKPTAPKRHKTEPSKHSHKPNPIHHSQSRPPSVTPKKQDEHRDELPTASSTDQIRINVSASSTTQIVEKRPASTTDHISIYEKKHQERQHTPPPPPPPQQPRQSRHNERGGNKHNDVIKFTDMFRKQIEEAESAQKYSSLMIGDPIEAMRRLLNGNA